MTTNYIHIGTLNDNSQDHHQELTINVPAGTNVNDIVRAFFGKDNAEDVQAEECTDAKNATVHREPNQQLPFFVLEKLEELGLYTYEQFATMYRKAVEGDAHTLADFLHKYEKVGVFDFRGYEKNEVYEALRDYFPTMKTYKYNNFVTYF